MRWILVCPPCTRTQAPGRALHSWLTRSGPWIVGLSALLLCPVESQRHEVTEALPRKAQNCGGCPRSSCQAGRWAAGVSLSTSQRVLTGCAVMSSGTRWSACSFCLACCSRGLMQQRCSAFLFSSHPCTVGQWGHPMYPWIPLTITVVIKGEGSHLFQPAWLLRCPAHR